MSDKKQRMSEEMQRIAAQERAAIAAEQPEKPDPINRRDIQQALYDNEVGDARLLVRLQRGRWVYDHSIDRWYWWAGHYWQADKVAHHLSDVDRLVECYRAEIAAINADLAKNPDEEETKHLEKLRDKLGKHLAKLQTVNRKKKILELARSGVGSLGTGGEHWDRDPWALPCVNGLVDLRTGNLMDGRPEDYIRTVCPTKWEGLAAECPAWLDFLDSIFDGDEEMIGYLHRLFGYAVTGLNTEHMLPILQGQGRNGKGTMLETLRSVLGPLAGPIQAEVLLDSKFGASSAGPSPEILDLRGKRLVWASELNEGAKFNNSRIKWLTGGDTLRARGLFTKEISEWEPTHTLFLLTNPKPHASGDDYALWKRLHLVEFRYSFVDDPEAENERQRDPDLPEKLQEERSGILAWLVRGCIAWQERGIDVPEKVRIATRGYQADEDLLGQFVADCCCEGAHLYVRSDSLYDAYIKWAEDQHLRSTMTKTKFGRKMGDRRYRKEKNPCVVYYGLGLKNTGEEGGEKNDGKLF